MCWRCTAAACVAAWTICAPLPGAAQSPRTDGWVEPYRADAARIVAEATSTKEAWNRLAEFTDLFPGRLSGSTNLERAIAWSSEQLKKDGFENVRLEPVTVPHWVRGKESAEIVEPSHQPIAMAALGGSVGTLAGGLQAEVLVVRNWDELEAQAAKVKGRIVLYNVPFATDTPPLAAYQAVTAYRGAGASRAARLGAVAALLRSAGPTAHRSPHTGGMRYAADAPRIPSAAISAEDADTLQRLQDRGVRVVVRLSMEAHTLPDATSANVIAELRGREHPEEVVVIGGHIDSWDLAAGASDDGAGVIATWEAMRVLKKLKLAPRRTVRLVLFTNEENGLRGGAGYREAHAAEMSNHVLAFEADTGVFNPQGFGFTGSEAGRAMLTQVASLLQPIGVTRIDAEAEAPDLGPMVRNDKVPAASLAVDLAPYFLIHHTPADTVDKIDPADLSRSVAAIATLAYVVADAPVRLR